MELIYFYIHRSANHFIEKNGFNFSSKYKFSVTHDDKKCYLTGNKNENSLPERFFDNTGCVTNVTAIVGENGSGKTTLLNEILSYSTVSSQMTEILSIYLEGTKLICCHNIGGFENHTDLLQEENIHCLKDGPDEFISRIYISNSTYVDAVDHYDIENSEQVVLNPDEIRRLKNKFFKKGIGYIVGGYYELRDVAILESIKISQFQHILDVLYLEHLYSENIDSTFAEEIGKNLNISFYRIGEYLNDFYGTSQKEENQFQQYHMQMQEVLKKIEYESSEENIFTDLYINLLYELLVYLVCSKKSKDIFEKLISNKEETAKKDLKTLIDKLLREANKDTFKDAFDEIKKYEECLKESQIPNNFSYHNRYIHIKYGNRAYEDFLCLIKESAFHRTTYVTFIDSDDYIDDNYLKYMYDLILKENAQICMVQGQLLLENEEPHKFPINVEKCVSTEEAIRMMLLRKEATHTSWGKLYDVSLWENIRFPKGQNYEDYATTYHVFSKATRVVYSDAKLYYYIQRLGSIMHDACSIKTLSVLDVADNVSEYLLTKWPESSDEILDLQAHTYLKNLQQILNSGNKAFLEYQNRIILFIKDNRHKLLTSNRVPLNDKVKIVSLMLGKGVFLKVYNFCDGNRKVN